MFASKPGGLSGLKADLNSSLLISRKKSVAQEGDVSGRLQFLHTSSSCSTIGA
jgi:hypothetical protein